jgi:uncharacterized repeat protein (TIGR03803 family)
MQPKQMSATLIRVLAALVITLTLAHGVSAAGTFKVLHSFKCGADGCGSYAGVTLDAAGNVYSAPLGGANNAGIIVKLTQLAGGRWNYQVLHTLTYSEGDVPFAGVTLDPSGNIYGTARGGGHDSGTVFELIPGGPTSWSASVLYNFCSEGGGYCTDGADPFDGPILDKAGSLYGTTRDGGANGGGVAFELAPGAAGWTETVLYSFCPQNDCSGGAAPYAGLIFDAAGNLYGANEGGGAPTCPGGCGTIFELSPGSGGKWNETLLHSFNGTDGAGPYAGVVFDASGNLYGAAFHGAGYCNSLGCGTLFKLTHGADGKWKYRVLHRFPNGNDGANPNGPLVLDKAGNLYGTTQYGGGSGKCPAGCGVVFKLSPGKKGSWTYSVLHRFTGGADGGEPWIGPTIDSKGNLYGTTMFGGTGGGVVFELTP